MLELLCRLQAISSFAKDCHYHFNEYSQHLLADVNEDDLEKQIDLINEVCYLGQGEEAPAKKDILAGALDYIAQPSNDEKENFAKLKLMIKECLVHLEQTEAKTRGANALLDNIAMTLQQLHGLLFKTVDDVKDIEYLNSLPDLMEEENYNESDKDVDWITVKGNHIPVEEGDTKKEAAEKFIEEKKDSKTEKITRKSENMGKPGRYVLHRAGNLKAPNGMIFLTPKASTAGYYADEDTNNEFDTYEIDIKNPLVIEASTDVQAVRKAYKELNGEEFTKEITSKVWQKLDKKNSEKLKDSKYDAIMYKIDGEITEVQIQKDRAKDLEHKKSHKKVNIDDDESYKKASKEYLDYIRQDKYDWDKASELQKNLRKVSDDAYDKAYELE